MRPKCLLKFNDTKKYKFDRYVHDVETLGKILWYTDQQIKDSFKQAFLPYVQVHMYRTQGLKECIAMVWTFENVARYIPAAIVVVSVLGTILDTKQLSTQLQAFQP